MPTTRQLFLSHLAQTSPIPLGLEIVKAEGCYMYDASGKKYLDLISGIGVSSLGHRHPKVVAAIKDQVGKYLHLMVYGEYIQSPQVAFAKLLTDNLPATLDCVYFTNSGTEATEGAMKLAKRSTGRSEIIGCTNSYHGSTQGALSIAGDEWFKNAFRPLIPGTRQIRYNNIEDIALITANTAAVFIEPIQAEAGGLVPDPEYLQAVRQKCNETGTLLVFDEIQTGFGRTGSLFNFQEKNIVPDILLLGKALGGGMPLGAFISSHALMQHLTHDPVLGHITTFGGHPVSCAAGKATLEVLLESKLIETVTEKEALIRSNLIHPKIKAIRGKGLLLAVEVADFDEVQKVIQYSLENGLVTDWFLFNDQCIRMAPPLVITNEEIEWACNIIKEGLDS
jgi:acetylornithine/N-succinyldiaminopimelate aminotransferase